MNLKGLFTALITPFKEDFKIDLEGMSQNIEHQIEQGVSGIVLLGTTGESSTLTQNERKILIRTAANLTRNRVHLMVGTGTNATATTLENTLIAKDLGANSALVVCPYYNKPSQEGLFLHFKQVAEKADFPLCLYNVPGRTQVNLSCATLKQLLDIEQIVSLKDATGNLLEMMDVLMMTKQYRPDFTVLCGDDALTFPFMCLGGHGVISVASNLIPKEVQTLVEYLYQKRNEDALQLHYQLLPLIKALFTETNPMPIKAAMNFLNMPAGPCRLPLTSISAHCKNLLEAILAPDCLVASSKP